MSPKQIKKLRGGMTLGAFALLVGVTPEAVCQWETGMKNPSGPVVILLRLMEKIPGMKAKMADVLVDRLCEEYGIRR